MSVIRKSATPSWAKVESAMLGAVYSGLPDQASTQLEQEYVFPGAVLLVGVGDNVVFNKAFGCRSLVPEQAPVQLNTVFDVAALTQVLVTVPLAMQMVDRNALDVDSRLSRIFQTFGIHGKERMSVRHLLTHCSGYPASMPFYRQIAAADRGARAGIMGTRGAVEAIYREIYQGKLDNLPGKVCNYSDVGFILLGHALEVVGGMNLDKLTLRNIIAPLMLQSTGFIDLSTVQRRGLEPDTEAIASSGYCSWRGRVLVGEVHDDNAWAMGGVAAHSGIFSSAADIHRIASHLLDCWHGRGGLFSREVVKMFWSRDNSLSDSCWALGWEMPKSKISSCGRYFSQASVGCLGHTGCSLWIDPEQEITVVLLTNAIHPEIDKDRQTAFSAFLPYVHDLVMEALA